MVLRRSDAGILTTGYTAEYVHENEIYDFNSEVSSTTRAALSVIIERVLK